MAASGTEGGALKGLRLLTVDRGPKGFGFHMYTNKVLKVSVRRETHERKLASYFGGKSGSCWKPVDLKSGWVSLIAFTLNYRVLLSHL